MKKNIFLLALFAFLMTAGNLYAQPQAAAPALQLKPDFFSAPAMSADVIPINTKALETYRSKSIARTYYYKDISVSYFRDAVMKSRSIFLSQLRYAKSFLKQS